jgi:two-component system, cell cycle sensor histidine kinase and response regulator CckA
MMPGMDGAAILSVLREFNPQVRAIAMSGVHSIEAIAQAEKNGFQSFLPKPFEARDLLQLLSSQQRLEASVLV